MPIDVMLTLHQAPVEQVWVVVWTESRGATETPAAPDTPFLVRWTGSDEEGEVFLRRVMRAHVSKSSVLRLSGVRNPCLPLLFQVPRAGP